jgi:CubicO group peptidase (beta-lactamase class C family)
MIRCLAAFMIALGLLVAPLQAAAAAAPAPDRTPSITAQDLEPFFDGLVPYAIRRDDIPGAVLIVVKGDQVVFAHGYGFANIAKRAPVLPDRTLFRPGSVSKLFTWTAVMQLVQAGKLNLDADVNQYLDFKVPPAYGQPVTLRDLMTHTAGFEEVIRELFVKRADQLTPMRAYLVNHMPARIFPPGKIIAYSNYGATLAGYIVQRVSGEPFDAYIDKHILTPLRMDHTTFEQPLPPRLAPLMAEGYMSASDGKAKPFEFVNTAPAGAASATAGDMAHFMIAYLNGGRYDGGTILSPATIREMFTLQVAPAPGMNGYDLGFYQENRNGLEIVGHAGDTDYFHSDLHLLPQEHVGIFMSFNSPGKAGAVEDVRTQIFRHFLDRYFPYAPPSEATVANPKPDAARVSGWYDTSRKEIHALRLVYTLGQTSVTARPNGEIEVSMLKDPAGNPIPWREVGPLYYREVDGQSHLKFTTDASGNIVSFTSDDFIPVFIFQRVNGLMSLGSVKTLMPVAVIVLVLSLLIRLGAWIARRRLEMRLTLTKGARRLHLVARIGAILLLIVPAAWIMVLSGGAILESSLVAKVIALYVLGVLAIIGGLAIVAETALRVMRGPGGWLVRSGEILVGLAGIYGIWFVLAFGLANFVTNF